MIFQKPKPIYTQEAINQQVTNLERLHKLRDMCSQKLILEPEVRWWRDEVERYSRDVESGQRYLAYMTDKVAGVRKAPRRAEGG